MVKLITDSTNDLNKDLLEKLNIEVMPLYVNFGEESLKDGVDITTEELYKKVEETGILPKTSAISVADFISVFQKYIDLGYEIVFTGISSFMSSTFQNANLAKEEVAPDKIFVVDSKNLSSGIGLLLLKASKDIENGLSASEVAKRMEHNTDLVLSQFVIEKMDYLYKGGRCSGVAKFVGTLLKIKPYIIVRDGKMSVGKKPIGKMQIALNALLKQIEEDKDRVDLDHILITHSIAYEYRDYLYERLKEMFPNVDIISTVAGCVISSHCGKGTIGILYMLKEEYN